nr:RNA-directed DNA polymerase, eukaryota [Tanacetum cinerariifolium]
VCIKTRIHGYIKDTCKVTVSGKSFNVFVNEFVDWNPDIKDSDSLPSINSEKDQSVNHKDGLSDNGSPDTEEGEIPNSKNNEVEDFVKNTQWSEEADLGNSRIKHEDPVRSPKENSDVPLDDPKSLSQPPGFEAFNSNSNISSARKPHKSYKQPSHFSSAPVKSSRTWIASHIHCFMINVYAPQDANNKILLWNEIRDFMNNNKGLHLLFGDFNEVIFSSDRIGTVFNPSSANSFNQLIRDNNLWDIPLGGHLFTRLNKRDHMPILLAPMAVDFGPTPFKFFNSWLEDKNLHSCINDLWTSYNTDNCMNPIVSFKNKMKDLKNVIKEWSKNHRKDQIREKEDIIKKINAFDANITSRSSDFVADDQRSSWIDSLHKIEVNESLDLSQKAKIKRCIEADENSKFFHAMVNQKRRYLAIHGIKLDGHWIDEPHGIKEAFTSFFEQKFKNIEVTKVVNRSLFYNSLSTEQSCLLDSPITLDEIKNSIWDCGSDKSPGPDGFTFAVYKEFWSTMKDDVAIFVKHFFNTGCLNSASTSILINGSPTREFNIERGLRQGDPLSPLLFIIAMEGLHVAMEDAMAAGCLNSASTSILINGSPTREFNIERGLRQGDPLSPLLFFIAMEGLHVAMEDAMAAGLYNGFSINNLSLSHLFFADDALFIGLPIDCNMARIKSWDPIVEKFSKRLSNWRASILSIGGRATLTTSVLGALGTYYFSLFPMTSLVNKKLKTLRANFFWGSGENFSQDSLDFMELQMNSTLAKITEQITSITSLCEMTCNFVQKKQEEKRIEEEQVAKAQTWKLFDDDDDEESSNSLNDNIFELPPFSAIIPDEPVLSTEEPDNSLSMRDEHLNTIPVTKSDEVIKSGVENLILIPSESEGTHEHRCDVPFHDNSPPLDVSKDTIEDLSESNEEFSSTDDDSFSLDNIDYVEASPPDSELVSSKVMEIVIPEVGGIKTSNDNPIPSYDPIISGTPPNLTPSGESKFFSEVDAFLAVEDEFTSSQFPKSDLDPEGDMLLFESFLNDDHSFNSQTKSSSTSLNSLLEETHTFDNSLP